MFSFAVNGNEKEHSSCCCRKPSGSPDGSQPVRQGSREEGKARNLQRNRGIAPPGPRRDTLCLRIYKLEEPITFPYFTMYYKAILRPVRELRNKLYVGCSNFSKIIGNK